MIATKNAPPGDGRDGAGTREGISGHGKSSERAADRQANSAPSGLPQFLRDLLGSPPRHGDGVHQWLFKVARQLHAHRDAGDIRHLLAAAVEGCGRAVTAKEIADAVENSRAAAWQPTGRPGAYQVPAAPAAWPEADTERISVLADADPGAFAALQKSSPQNIDPRKHDAECILERLFPGDPLLCVAEDGPKSARVLHRSGLRGVAGKCGLIVPSAMTAERGTNQQGRETSRCLDNTGPRAYLITEFDQGDKDTQAAVLRHLSAFAPLVMVVDSAGKSLHGWWYCKGKPEALLKRFFRMAVRLGADPATWTRCQLVRMPLGWRHEKDARQVVPFFAYMNTAFRKDGEQ